MPELIRAAPGSPEWLAARRTGVTAADIVTILGLSSWDSAYSLYWRKLGQVPEQEDTPRFALGRYLESYVADCWELDPDRDPADYPEPSGLWRHSDRSWQMATLDRMVHHAPDYPALYDEDPVVAVLELKTWADADRHSWQDAPPATVRAQVLWQMDVMDVAVGHVGVVFLPSGEFRSYELTWEDDTQRDIDLMRLYGEEFMARLRLELPAPDPDSSAASLAAVRARFARTPDKQAEVDANTWETWLNWKRAEESAVELKREAEIKLRHEAGEASVYTVEGQPVARRITGEAHVKAHTRHSDYLKRINPETDAIQHALAQGKPMFLAKKEGKATRDAG